MHRGSAVRRWGTLEKQDIEPPERLERDGKLRRCDAVGKCGKGDAAYQLYVGRFRDGSCYAVGGFQNWRIGDEWVRWTPEGQDTKLSEVERQEVKAATENARRQRLEDRGKGSFVQSRASEGDGGCTRGRRHIGYAGIRVGARGQTN
jgi:hypothetical protein